MPKPDSFPLIVREQSVTVKIYRLKAKTTESGFAYCVAWVGPNGRERETLADLKSARDVAHRKAAQLANGLNGQRQLDRSDLFELTEARAIAGTVPVLSALKEWRKAQELAGPAILEACAHWASRRSGSVKRITVAAAVTGFIKAKDDLKKQGSRTYASKLKPLTEEFGDRYAGPSRCGEHDGLSATGHRRFARDRLATAATRPGSRSRVC